MNARTALFRILLAASLFGVYGEALKAQQPGLETLSTRVAQRISKAGKQRVFVADFLDEKGQVTQLGRELAGELSRLMGTSGNHLYMFPRLGQSFICNLTGATADLLSKCAAMGFGASTKVEIVILGRISAKAHAIAIELQMWKCPDWEKSSPQLLDTSLAFRESVKLPATQDNLEKRSAVLLPAEKGRFTVTAGTKK
ncbi:MAG: hypothetical protein HY234_12670 [Acidobacteria bacterium]|nr:hypothetical protein [Acidobacteriota bacterium]MBI3663888.1 hypothetical protein [Acidobacteriota bacterium]